MRTDLALVLTLFAAAVMFSINRPRMDAVALLLIALLPFTGVIQMGEVLPGFSDSNRSLIAARHAAGPDCHGRVCPHGVVVAVTVTGNAPLL